MHMITSSARRQCCLVEGSPSPQIISLTSLVLWIRLSDRVCNLRGHEVRRLYLGPCAPGPAGGLLESPQGISMSSDSYSPAIPYVGNQELSVCNKTEGEIVSKFPF